MDVVVDQPVTILQVLTLRNAVGGDQQVDLTFRGEIFGPFLGARRKRGEDRYQILAQPRQGRLVPAGAGNESSLQPQLGASPRRQLLVQIAGGVRERREDDHLAVGRVDGVAALPLDHRAQLGELGVARRR